MSLICTPVRRLIPSSLMALLGAFLLVAAPSCAPPEPEAPAGFPLTFRAGDLGTRLGPRFLPASVTVPLTPSDRTGLDAGEPLEGFLRLGPKLGAGEPGFPLVVGRDGDGEGWRVLFVETGGMAGEELTRAEPTAGHLGGQPVFRLDLRVEHREPGGERADRYVVEVAVPAGDAPPESLTAYGFGERLSRVKADGLELTVLLADGDSDGVFGAGDPWVVLEDAALLAAPFTPEMVREVGDFAWAGGRAWMLRLDGTSGQSGALVPHDPGITEAEDGQARETWAADRAAARAPEPWPCPPGNEPGPADGTPRLIFFSMDSCAQCRAMEELVLTSAVVAGVGERVACRRVDVKEFPAALHEEGLTGVPAGVVMDADGDEVARFEGYRGATELAALIRTAGQ